MILSSADILKILGGNEIIRLSATVSIVDGKPSLTGEEGTRIHIDRFPRVDEFQATWSIYIESDEDTDLIVAELRRLLPSVHVSSGLLTTITTTDFRSDSTQRAPEAPKAQATQVDLTQYEERFQSLVEDVQDQMLLVTSGRPGRDGKDGLPGAPGRDGKDIDATDTELFDLKDADQSVLPMEKGQVLTWDGSKWTNLYVPDRHKVAGGGGNGGGGGAPNDAVSATVQWKFDNAQLTDTLSDGTFHTDSIDGELVTKIRVSHLTGRNNDITVLISDLLTQGYDRLYIAQSDDLSQAQLYLITGFVPVTDGTELTVTHLVTAGIEPNFLNNKNYEFYISQSAGGGSGGSVISVNSQTGIVVLDAADVGAATTAQGALADTAVQPGDNVSALVNDAGYITASEVPADSVQSVNGEIGVVVIDADDIPVAGTVNKFTTTADINKLAGIETGAQVNEVNEAPQDGNYYVRKDGGWVPGDTPTGGQGTIDGGNFDTGTNVVGGVAILDGGLFT